MVPVVNLVCCVLNAWVMVAVDRICLYLARSLLLVERSLSRIGRDSRDV